MGRWLFKRGERGRTIVGLSEAEPVIDGTGEYDLVYLLVLIVHKGTWNDCIQLSLYFGAISMRVKVIVSDWFPFFLVEYGECVGDDRQF